VDLYRPLFELLRKESEATAIPVFTTNYDLALEKFKDQVKKPYDYYGMIDGFQLRHAGNRLWDPNEYHRFDLSALGTKPVTLILFKLHGSVFWQKNEEKIVFNDQPTSEEIEYVLLYPTQTKTIVEDPFLTCYNYFEECLRNAKLMIAIGYSFGDDYLNQVIARCQLANPELKIMVFNPGFEDNTERRKKFDSQIGVSEENRVYVYYNHFDIGKQGEELLREVKETVERQRSRFRSSVLIYDFIDKLKGATLRNDDKEHEKIRPIESALSRRNGGTAMRAIYAHPGHDDEDTEVMYELPAEFAVARRLLLVFAVAVLGEHPVRGEGSKFKDIAGNSVRFKVRVNGKTVFKREFDAEDPHLFEWEHHAIPITEGKERTLKVDLITNAMGKLAYNWTAWGEPKLIDISSI
jgi:hypothetical protein